ncbi:phospholipase D-like domain-containing protein [Thermococcus camini]|uniref:Phospholipase D-related protein n=1 Tax=Thermococcus camini TaxID=2016373 RepID=A0A7G2D3Z0_9EURY|nr:phospholipase D-like domain-containing protein [Thermococcus camini]CAD5243207.1 Phospholipase D-related protein [Thermococcus camini]
MRSKVYLLAILVAVMLVTSGCLGSTSTLKATSEKTTTLGKTRTVTETITVTETRYIVNHSAETELRKNLTACLENLRLLNTTLDRTSESLDELREKYRDCLLEKSKAGEKSPPVEILVDDAYYRSVIEDIRGARESVYVTMFLMKYDPTDSYDHANDLIRALVEARRRGVSVHVILENGIEDNRATYDYLRSNGVDVVFDSPSVTLHTKMVVIDGGVVYIGSHNWSEAALDWNHEVSVRIESQEIAESLLEYFEEIRRGY